MFFAKARLSTQLVFLVTSAIMLAVAVCIALAIVQTDATVRQEIDQRSTALVTLTGDLLAAPVARHDTAGMSHVLQMVVRQDALAGAVLFDTTGSIVIEQRDAEIVPDQEAS